jgi:hypothetical protein
MDIWNRKKLTEANATGTCVCQSSQVKYQYLGTDWGDGLCNNVNTTPMINGLCDDLINRLPDSYVAQHGNGIGVLPALQLLVIIFLGPANRRDLVAMGCGGSHDRSPEVTGGTEDLFLIGNSISLWF